MVPGQLFAIPPHSKAKSSAGVRPQDGAETMSERNLIEGPNGRVFSLVPNEGGPKSLTFDAHGEAATLLRDAGYVVRVVVERLDKSGFTESGQAFVTTAMEAEARGESATGAAATVHFRAARDRLAAKAPTKPVATKSSTKASATKPGKPAA